MLVTLLLILFSIHLLLERKGSKRWIYVTDSNLRTTIILSCFATVILLLPLAVPYLRTAHNWHFYRGLEGNSLGSTEPLCFLLRPCYSFASYYGWLHQVLAGKVRGGDLSNSMEAEVFLGITPWLLAGFTLLTARRPRFDVSADERAIIRRYAWAAFVVGILMLGPYLILFDRDTHIPLPYQLVYYLLPGAKAMRVPARFVQTLLLCLAVIGGFGVAALLKSMAGWGRIRKAVAILFFAFFFRLDYAVLPNEGVLAEPRDRFPPVYEYLAKSGINRPVLELPVDGYKYLYYQTGHWKPLLGGHSGWLPPCRTDLSERMGNCPSGECFNFIRYTPAATLVVHLDDYSDAQRAAWETADLSQFGFNFVGKFGSALVWERGTEDEKFSGKLAVSEEDLVFDYVRGKIWMALRPSEHGKAWRYFVQDSTDVEAAVTAQDGKEIRWHRAIKIPSYLLPGEKFRSDLSLRKVSLSKLTKIHLRGTLLEDCLIDLARSSPASPTSPGQIIRSGK
jgi:hypothetical protein